MKVFPCDCCGDGLVVTVEKDLDLEDMPRGPFINITFWEYTKPFSNHQLRWLDRIKLAWRLLKGETLWTDMVILNANIARKFANHILYLLSREKPTKNQQKFLIVK